MNRKDDTTVQGFASVVNANPWSGWHIFEVPMTPSDYTTPASPFTGMTAQAATNVYLYNVESGMWFQNNNRQQDNLKFQHWTTRGGLGNYGIDVNLTEIEGGFQINPKFGHKYSVNGTSFYLDTDRNPDAWTFTPITVNGVSNAYTISNNLMTWGSDINNYLRGGDLKRTTWQIVSRDERMNYIAANASASNPIDVSFLVGNPDLANNNDRNAWIITRDGGSEGFNDNIRYNRNYWASEFNSLDMSQTEIAVPNGTYQVVFSLMYSPTALGDVNIDDYNAYKTDGDATVYVVGYANGETIKARSVYSVEGTSNVTNVHQKQVGDYFFPGGPNQVNGTMAIGNYQTEPLTVTVTDGKLSLGIKNLDGCPATVYVGFSGVKLTYLGQANASGVVLNDNESNASTIGTLVGETKQITVNRSFTKEEWNTIVVPFDINDIESVFGTGSEVVEFSNEDSEGVIHFVSATAILAGVPYLVYPTNDITSIVKEAEIKSGITTVTGTNYDFVGVYDPTIIGSNDYYLAANNTLKRNTAGTEMKAFRAYFKNKGDASRTLTDFTIDDVATGIIRIENGMMNIYDKTGVTYDLTGRKVGTLTKKGVYIANGKKIIK